MNNKIINDIDIMKALQTINYLQFCKYKFDIVGLNDDIDFLSAKLLLDHVDNDDIQRCDRLLHNRYKRKSRIYKCIDYMLSNYPVCYFCTMTLNDDSLNLTMKYLKGELTKSFNACHTCYLGNVDFGEEHGRLHFHVIVAENDIHICKDNLKWPFGLYDIKVINDKDSTKLGSYIMKLVNHATKETTKDKIITPRGEFSFAKLLKK